MLALAPLKEDMEEHDLPILQEQPFPYKLQPLDKEEEMEILSSIKQETEETTRDRIVDSLAASYPAGALSKVFQVKEEDDPLSASCFAEIRLDRSSRMDEGFDSDDELTSLSWLHDSDLLSGLRVGSECGSPCDDDGQKENDFQSGIYGQPHPPHVPYNPQKHINSKPPYSFSCLIFMAIEDNPDKKLPVKDIYNWILTHFPYFQNAPTGWKNSVRHNLSLNKCFKKVEKDRCSNIGKGSLWMIDPDFRPNLLQALRKTPYHPYHQLQMFNNAPATSPCSTNGTQKPLPLQPRYNVNTPSPHLFPFLSRRLAQSSFVTSGSDVSVSDIDVANTLVSLKRAAENRRHARSRSPSPPEFGSEREKELLKQKKLRAGSMEEIVWYAPPNDDHSYSLTEDMLQQGAMSPESSIDEEYDFGTNDKSTSEVEDEIFSESDYDEEGWSEEEELYEREKLKLYSRAPIITHDSVASQAGSRRGKGDSYFVEPTRGAALLLKASSAKNHHNHHLHHHKQHLRNPPPLRRVGGDVRYHHAGAGVANATHHQSISTTPSVRDPEEDLKIAEGANALLNLAGIRSAHIVPLRSISPSNNNNNIVKLDHIKVEEMET